MKFITLILTGLWLVSSNSPAVQLRYDDSGEVLIFPFFSAENDWESLIHIPGSQEEGVSIFPFPGSEAHISMILKLRVREGINGKEVNRFNIYTHYSENWRASISRDANNNVVLHIVEGECIVADNLKFGGAGSQFQLGTSMGTIEIYKIGFSSTFEDVRDGKSTADCEEIANRWKPQGIWLTDPRVGVSGTSNSTIAAEMTLLNVKKGLAASYTATALSQFKDKDLEKNHISHTSPSDPSPNLAEAKPLVTSMTGVDVVPESGQGIDAIAAVLSHDVYENDVVTEESIGASTDWVISYPLAGYKNHRPFTVTIDGNERYCETLKLPPEEGKPIIETESVFSEPIFISWGQGQRIGEVIDPTTISPRLPRMKVGTALCSAVNVISFEGRPSVLAFANSPNVKNISGVIASDASMLKMQFVDSDETGFSRPVLGFRLTTFVNGTLEGGKVLANYAVLKPHLNSP